MPRNKRQHGGEELMVVPSLVAAARRLTGRPDYTKLSKSGRAWQDQAWTFYDTIGELRYGADWVGNMLSRATLYLARDGEPVPVDDQDVAGREYLTALFGGPEMQGEMLRQFGVHLTVAGELYMLGTTSRADGDRWLVAAATELTVRSGTYYVAGSRVDSDSEPFVLRVWRPHPRKPVEANSPTRAVLSVLAEIDALSKHVFAQLDSRLAGAGVLFTPSEFTLPSAGPTAGAEAVSQVEATSADRFQTALQDAMVASIQDRTDASAVVPIVVTVPGEYIDKAKHLTFWSPLDEHTQQMRNAAIRRLALGLDMPPEQLTGSSDLNHWNLWGVEEAAIKVHAEPLLGLICESLTEGYLWPLLRDDGMDPADAERYAVAPDTSLLRLRPNRSQEAFELYDRGQLSPEALLREVGFDDSDAPSGRQVREWFLRKVAAGQTTPDLVADALRALGVEISSPGDDGVSQARPRPSLENHPHRDPPPVPADVSSNAAADALLAASEVVVQRALERAGNRLRNRLGRKFNGVPAARTYLHVPVSTGQLDFLLEGAFDGLDNYVGCRTVAPDKLATCLDTYCRALLTEGRPHDAQVLATYLELTRAV